MNLYKKMLKYPKLIISKSMWPCNSWRLWNYHCIRHGFCNKYKQVWHPVKLGFIPALVSTFLLNKIKGLDVRELLLTGQLVTATQAKDIGLINKICNLETIDETVEKFIKKTIASTSTNSIMETKKMLYEFMSIEKKARKSF